MNKYVYVDAFYITEDGKAKNWIRIKRDSVNAWIKEKANNFNGFCTVQTFKTAERPQAGEAGKNEEHLAPLYFDLDYEENPEVSRLELVKIVNYFKKHLGLLDTDFYIYFSGSKGFHLLVPPEIFGIKPGKNLHKIFKHVAGFLKFRLGEVLDNEKIIPMKSVDFNVYTNPRQLRIENTKHGKTGKYKIELTTFELENFSIDQIRELASKPRVNGAYSETDRKNQRLEHYPEAVEFFRAKAEEFEIEYLTNQQGYNDEGFTFSKDTEPPVCVQDILENGWKKDGDRNLATVQLSCYFKVAGFEESETIEILSNWVEKHTSAATGYQKQQRRTNTRNVVASVFNPMNQYKFGCAFIRSLHGEKTEGSNNYDRVKCAGSLCPFVPDNQMNEEDAIKLQLSDCSQSEYVGSLVKTSVMIAGKKQTPYIVPKKLEFTCFGYNSCKNENCPLFNLPSHVGYRELTIKDRELIQMCGVPDGTIQKIIKTLSRVNKCAKYKTEIVESVNVEELFVIPQTSSEILNDIDQKSNYVLRKVYAIGDTSIEVNNYYELFGYVVPHPVNQEGTVMIKEAKPLQDAISRFKLKKAKTDLELFQPEGNTIEQSFLQLEKILNDLTANVTGIVERDNVLLSVLLTFFSPLRIKVPWNRDFIRGWLETVIIGDTGTGKSEMIDKLLKFVNLGTKVNAESTSRTGLTYKMENVNGSWSLLWGAWPLADRKLIYVDECSAIAKETWGQLTLARSDGKLEVKRVVAAETSSRVRALLTGNATDGKRLSDFTQGCASLKEIFNHEDIRRFDNAVFMRINDVSIEKYNAERDQIPQTFTSEVMKKGILFAWSRKPEQIQFSADCINEIRRVSKRLSSIYGAATDIPLVSPSDQNNKLARLASAVACLLQSVDITGENVKVKDIHVRIVESLLIGNYNAPGCGLNQYAKFSVKETDISEKVFERATDYMQGKVRFLKDKNRLYQFIKVFQTQQYIRFNDLEVMLAVHKDEAKFLISVLINMKFIQSTGAGLRKTARFNAYIAKSFQLGMFNDVDDANIFDDFDDGEFNEY